MSISYAQQTIDAPNPFRQYAQRDRLKKSIALASALANGTKILDYGCGSGTFVERLVNLNVNAVGYEPIMKERANSNLPIYSQLGDLGDLGPYGLVTLLETIEHLSDGELDVFVDTCDRLLLPRNGRILITAPIEIGPALLLKEFSRYLSSVQGTKFRAARSEYSARELLMAAFIGIPARRTEHIKVSHKGFDFRRSIRYLRGKGLRVKILSYGPLPIKTWYGNSQVFLLASR